MAKVAIFFHNQAHFTLFIKSINTRKVNTAFSANQNKTEIPFP